MIKGLEIEIFEILNPAVYDQKKFRFSVVDVDTDLEILPKNLKFCVPLNGNLTSKKFFLFYRDKEIGQCEICVDQDCCGKVSVLNFTDDYPEKKAGVCKMTQKIIQIRVYLRIIYEDCTQEYLNFLKSYVNLLELKLGSDINKSESLKNELEKKILSESLSERTIEQLEVQICEKNKIIQSFLTEFNELRKNSHNVNNENIELKKRLNESLGIIYTLTKKNPKISKEPCSDSLENQEKTLELHEKINDLEKNYAKTLQHFEEKSKDFNNIIEKLATEKNGLLKKCEKLEKLARLQKVEIEDLRITNLSQNSKICIQDSVGVILKSNELKIKSLEKQLFEDREINKKLNSEILEYKAEISNYKEREVIILQSKIIELQENVDSNNSKLLKALNDCSVVKTELIKAELELSVKNLSKPIPLDHDLNKFYTQEIEKLTEFNHNTKNILEHLDSELRKLRLLTTNQSKMLLEKDEELDSLKEIVIVLQNTPTSNIPDINPQRNTNLTKKEYSKLPKSPISSQKIVQKSLNGKTCDTINRADLKLEENFEDLSLSKSNEKNLEKFKVLGRRKSNTKLLNNVVKFSPSSLLKENLRESKSLKSCLKLNQTSKY